MKEKCGKICIYQKNIVILPQISINAYRNPRKNMDK